MKISLLLKSLKFKMIAYFLIIPIMVFFLYIANTFWIASQQLEKEAKYSMEGKEIYSRNSIFLYKKRFQEKSIAYVRDAKLFYLLKFFMKYPLIEVLKEDKKKNNLKDFIIYKNDKDSFFISADNDTTQNYKLEYIKILKNKDEYTYLQKLNGKIVIVSIVRIEDKNNKYLSHAIITKELDITDFFVNSVLLSKNKIQSVSQKASDLENFIKEKKNTINFTENLQAIDHFYINSIFIKDKDDKLIGKLVFGENFYKRYIYNLKQILYLIPVFIFLLGALIFVGYYLGSDIANPIIEMSKISQNISLGKIKIFPYKKTKKIRNDEIGILYKNFKIMVESFFKTQRDLRKLHNNLENEIKKAIKEIREKDHMLIKQSKQAAMGEMIGNIAHQWRQPLNAIGIIIQNIEDAYEFEELDEKYLEKQVKKTMELIEYMSQTIDDFRNFFKTDKEEKEFSLEKIIKNTVHLLESSFESLQIEIILDIKKDVIIKGFPNEYSQVLLNILSNAKDAIAPDKNKNKYVKIKLQKDKTGKSILKIFNTGRPIRKNILDKIFDPYFTTKHESVGTGIGLYMSKTIIDKNMKGNLYANNVKNGVEFTIEI